MKKYVLLILVCLPTLFFCLWTFQLSGQVENARLVTVPLRGYDPRDLLAGHYIQYDIDRNQFNVRDYPDCRLPNRWQERRFYIPEKDAEVLDTLFRQNQSRFSIVFACQEGRKAIAKQLLIDGRDWHDALKGR
ncbi:MAG: hypothetical protein IJV07_01995 [Alphaproteobacteria bacterium]|nr:hypothetical protein [Alphaproteobacteria bacterium]